MKRLYSDMPARGLAQWMWHRDLSPVKGADQRIAADTLGISRRQLQRHLAGERIPQSLALLCEALDRVQLLQETVTDAAVATISACADALGSGCNKP